MERSSTEPERETIIKHWETRVSVINLLLDPLSFSNADTLSGFTACVPRVHFVALTDRFSRPSPICSKKKVNQLPINPNLDALNCLLQNVRFRPV